ncbi:carbohydrate porin [Silvibacterium sp.]|uniref:carbohydrate porin n=1 Tax=Silvibacterium sp. TaxID=1964179 RepID=UPI0039E29F82
MTAVVGGVLATGTVWAQDATGQLKTQGTPPTETIQSEPQRNARFQPQAIPAIFPQQRSIQQELDAIAAPMAKIPVDPLYARDPLGWPMKPFRMAENWATGVTHINFGATYTFLNQYATVTPDGVRHDQLSGRLDVNGNWAVYNSESTAGSIGLLVRSGTNIGMSQQWNLSDRLGSGLYLNCLQGGGEQEPITLNILYWRQDFLARRLSFYVGKLHPNQHISLSMFNNDERTQFLNGENDGDLAIASDGTYAGGAAMEFQATPRLFIHALAVDTEGAQQRNIETLADRKYLEAIEVGWFKGFPGSRWINYRGVLWRNDTAALGSGHGGGIGFDHEFGNGWAPFGRFSQSTDKGTATKQIESVGVVDTKPFGRRSDFFGASFDWTKPSTGQGKRQEGVIETFYRLRMTTSVEVGPDMEISIHPTNAAKTYSTVLMGARMRIIF